MVHRKLVALAFGLAAVALALGFTVYRHRSPAPLEEVDVSAFLDPCGEQQGDDGMKSDASDKIEIEIRVVSVPAFANFAKDDRPVHGRLKEHDPYRLLQTIQGVRSAHIMQCPKCLALNGQPAKVVGLMSRSELAEDGVSIVQRAYGLKTVAVATLRKDGRIHLKVDFTDSTFSGSPPKPNFTLPTMKGSFVLDDKETAFMGGLKTKRIEQRPYAVPMLSDTPWIGSWFHIPREVEVECELLFLATTTIRKSP